MKLIVIGSSSKGNGYILDAGSEALILEAGVKFLDIKKALDFNIRKVVGCCITHRHNDHAKYIKAMVDAGFPTLALSDVWDAKGCKGYSSREIILGNGYRFGSFQVLPFAASHDVPCVGYLIQHPDMGRLMFLTDSFMCEYRFPGLNHVLIECNYSDRDLIQAINDGRTLPSQRERLMTSHLELNTCKGFLSETDLSKVSEIVLLHLSDNNANEDRFVSEISAHTGKPVYAAKPGLTLNLELL